MLYRHQESMNWVLRETFWRLLRQYGVDGGLLPAVKSLYSCLEVCVGDDGVKSPLFTMAVILQ